MAQSRYSRVFHRSELLHSDGFDFVIEAGAILIDSKTDSAVAQLKMQSLADAKVKAVTVTIQPEDTKGEPLGEVVTHQYLDLDVQRGSSFGQKTPIPLPDINTRSFSVVGVEVVYEGNSAASSTSAWTSFPNQKPLSEIFSDEETLKQYRIDFGESCSYELQELGELWRCSCGAINKESEDTCHHCGTAKQVLKDIDRVALEERKNARLEVEKAEREAQLAREQAEREEAEKIAAATKKRWKIFAGACAAALVVVGVLLFMRGNRAPGKADFGPESIFDVWTLQTMSEDNVDKYIKASTLDCQEMMDQRKDRYHVYGFSLGNKMNEALHLMNGQLFGLTDDGNNRFTCIMWYADFDHGLSGTHFPAELEDAAAQIAKEITPHLGLGTTLTPLGMGKGPDGYTDWVRFRDPANHNYVCIKFFTDGEQIIVCNKV